MAASPTGQGQPRLDRERDLREGRSVALSGARHGILVPGGFGERGSEGKIKGGRFSRAERKVPYFGICFGMQMAVIEAARSLAGIDKASSTEFGPTDRAGRRPDDRMAARATMLEKRHSTGDLGGTMRLGAYEGASRAGLEDRRHLWRDRRSSSVTAIATRSTSSYKERLEACGMQLSGMSPDGCCRRRSSTQGSSVVHRRAVSSGAEVASARAAPAVCLVHRGRHRPVAPRLPRCRGVLSRHGRVSSLVSPLRHGFHAKVASPPLTL
jgi:hypothetical protein